MLHESIPCDASAPARARRLIEGYCGSLDREMLDNVELMTTELVTNSVRHDCSEPNAKVELFIKEEGRQLRIAVKDGGSNSEPILGDPSVVSEGGRGMLLVDVLSDRWGTEVGDGLLTWFSLDLDDRSIQRG